MSPKVSLYCKKKFKNHEQNIFGEPLLLLSPHIPQLRKSNIGKHKEDQSKQSHDSLKTRTNAYCKKQALVLSY